MYPLRARANVETVFMLYSVLATIFTYQKSGCLGTYKGVFRRQYDVLLKGTQKWVAWGQRGSACVLSSKYLHFESTLYSSGVSFTFFMKYSFRDNITEMMTNCIVAPINESLKTNNPLIGSP